MGVPLNQTALDAIATQAGKHAEFVFTNQDKPLGSLSTKAFDKACLAAGIENFRFHDLRHTWASWLIHSGVGLAELQELGGWESVEMVRRYAHLAPDHLQKHSRQIDIIMATFSHTIEDDKKNGLVP
nr:site-specific integrase [Chitinimonas sp. BJB300]